MPVVDMPLAELHAYQGRNPRPADFDAYWDAALTEMHALDPRVELIPYDLGAPFADCFDLYFSGVGGARIHAKYLRPTQTTAPHPAVLMFHGYTGNAGDWSDKLVYVAQGFAVAALDCRGQGGRSEDVGGVKGNTHNGHVIRGLADAPEKLLFRQIYLDTAELARIVMAMPEVDATRVGAFGGSQGGALTLACAALEPRLARAAAFYPAFADFQRMWEMDLALEEIRTYFRLFDPRHEQEEAIFTRLGYLDHQFLAPRIRGEVLMLTGLMDKIVPPSTQFAAYNKITAKKRVVLYPDFGHEGLPDGNDIVFKFMAEMTAVAAGV